MDWNVIQAPELIRRLTKRLGLVQGHVTPTLNEGVQAVILLDDVSREDAGNAGPQRFAGCSTAFTAVAAGDMMLSILYPLGPGGTGRPTKSARLRAFGMSCNGGGAVRCVGGLVQSTAFAGGTNPGLPFSGEPPTAGQTSATWQGGLASTCTPAFLAALVMNPIINEFLPLDPSGLGRITKTYGDAGPVIRPGDTCMLFALQGTSGLQCAQYMEWEEF